MKKILFIILFLSITINAFAIIPIYCPNCQEHIYDYQNSFTEPDEIKMDTVIYAKHFIPMSPKIRQPTEEDEMLCPLCNKYFDGWNYYSHYNKCVVRNVINSIVLLTKDSEGFKWIPYDIDGTPYTK